MTNSYRKLFKNLDKLEPTGTVYKNTLGKIDREIIRITRNRYLLLGLASCFSVTAAIPVSAYLLRDLAQSGFLAYLSLIFSDGGAVLSSWKEFMPLIAESLPALSIAAALSVFFVVLISLRLTIKNARSNFSTA